MKNVKRGIVYGLIYAVLDVLPMFAINIPDVMTAVAGAFINRFAIGFLIPLTTFPSKGWQRGLMLGLMLSLPDAIITKAYVPILSLGIIGGLVIGIIDDRMNKNFTE
ncbi:MAG: Uncharacterized protein FD122_3765 [Stygiobacter sp.]|nr:MAG: Uncharacterized protein FD122_3765 [Stygiobacter sp.]